MDNIKREEFEKPPNCTASARISTERVRFVSLCGHDFLEFDPVAGLVDALVRQVPSQHVPDDPEHLVGQVGKIHDGLVPRLEALVVLAHPGIVDGGHQRALDHYSVGQPVGGLASAAAVFDVSRLVQCGAHVGPRYEVSRDFKSGDVVDLGCQQRCRQHVYDYCH